MNLIGSSVSPVQGDAMECETRRANYPQLSQRRATGDPVFCFAGRLPIARAASLGRLCA
jgi:hypothetical protein